MAGLGRTNVMSIASENMASTAFVPDVNEETWMSALGSRFLSGPLSASSTSPGAWVTFGKTPKRTVAASASGPGTPASGEEETGAEAPGALDADVVASVVAAALAGADVDEDPALQAAMSVLPARIRAAVRPSECRVTWSSSAGCCGVACPLCRLTK